MRLTIDRITRLLRWSGPLHSLFPIWGFVDDHTFITKSGSLGVVYQLTGIDAEGLDVDTREAYGRIVEGYLKIVSPDTAVYQYLWKRPTTGGLFRIETYCALVHDGLHAPTSWRNWWSPAKTLRILSADLDRSLADTHAAAHMLIAHLSALSPRQMDKTEIFHWLRDIIHDDPVPARLKYDTHVDYFLCDVGLDVHRDHLEIGHVPVRVLSMTDAPAATFAGMLADLYAVPGEFLACVDWQRLSTEHARFDLHHRRRHFSRRRTTLLASALTEKTPLIVDDGASSAVSQLGSALAALEVDGHCFGSVAFTIVTRGSTAQQVAARLRTVLATHDGRFIEETYNALPAWASVLPGNRAFNLRRLALLETHAADLSFLWSVDTGRDRDDAGRPPVLTLTTQQATPYRYHIHQYDVGHTLVLGATGSGKTYLLNAIVDEAQQYSPRTIIFDIGHGYRNFATRHGGAYIELGLRGMRLNPWNHQPTADHLHFLAGFVRVLLESDADPIPEDLRRSLHDAVAEVYEKPADQHRIGSLILPRVLQPRLTPWLHGGRYGEVFDHPIEALYDHACQVYEFSGLDEYPELIPPLLFYLLHHVSVGLNAKVLTLCVMDEAWKFVKHPTFRAYVQSALKTWRKHNGAVLLATQAIEDFGVDDFLRTVVESCPTQLLLHNPNLARDHYARLLNLNDQELNLLSHVRPRGQVLMKRIDIAKVLDVEVACVA